MFRKITKDPRVHPRKTYMKVILVFKQSRLINSILGFVHFPNHLI